METIQAMGFAPDQASAALQLANNNVEQALELLLTGDPRCAVLWRR